MAYRNPDARRGGGGFVWPYTDPRVAKPPMPHYRARHVPRIESWQDRLYQRQHRSSTPTYVAPSPSNSSSASYSTAQQNSQPRLTTGSWKQNRAVARCAGLQEAPTLSTGNATMPVEEALKRLHRDLKACKTLCMEYQRTFDEHAGQLSSRVKSGTLDKVWRDMLAHHDLESFKDATNRVRSRMRDLKAVLAAGRPSMPRGDSAVERDPEVLERRVRAGTKALSDCEQLVGLFDRARVERKACNLLVEELEMVTGVLDPSNHPSIYHDSEGDKVDVKGKGPTPGYQNNKGRGIQKGKTAAMSEGKAASGSSNPDNDMTAGYNHEDTNGNGFDQQQVPDPQQEGDNGEWSS